MPKGLKPTKDNPRGLSSKQLAVIDDFAYQVKSGHKPDLLESHKRHYQYKNNNVIRVTKTRNLKNPDFRAQLIEALYDKKIIGTGGKVQTRLEEGLDAVGVTPKGKEYTDYQSRLAYIKEINKITGAYAPTRTESKNLNLNLDMSNEELDQHIASLQNQLQD